MYVDLLVCILHSMCVKDSAGALRRWGAGPRLFAEFQASEA